MTLIPLEIDVFSQEIETSNFWIIGNSISDSTLSKKELQSIFLGDFQNWDNGSRVKIVFHKSKTNEFELTSRLILNSSATEMKKYWLSLVFQGRVSSPVFQNTCDDIIEFVKNNEGAIAIIYNTTPPSDLVIEFDSNE